jgi:hypothetical protein
MALFYRTMLTMLAEHSRWGVGHKSGEATVFAIVSFIPYQRRMTEDTKQRLRERFEQILNAQETFPQPNKKYRTLADIERMALNIREEMAQATLEEMAKEEKEQEKQSAVACAISSRVACSSYSLFRDVATKFSSVATQISAVATKLPCPHCYKNAHYKGMRQQSIQTLAGIFSFVKSLLPLPTMPSRICFTRCSSPDSIRTPFQCRPCTRNDGSVRLFTL